MDSGGQGKQEESPHLVLTGESVVLRPLLAEEARPLASRMLADPDVAEWWVGSEDEIVEWLTESGSTAFAIEVDRTLAGAITYEEENDPHYRFAALDIGLLGDYIGRGHGPDALRTLLRYLFEVRGHHRAIIDPAVANERAIHVYEKVGYKPVGVMRRYELARGGRWRDSLLMDILAEELT